MNEGCLCERGECRKFSAKLDRWLMLPLLGLACLAGGSIAVGSAITPRVLLDGRTGQEETQAADRLSIDFVAARMVC